MNSFDPNAYGPVFAPLLHTDRRRSLAAGQPESAARAPLSKLTVDSAFKHTRIADHDMAACCISGVWLLHDCLDDSHKISQDIDTPSGSFWHGIMHRREGDFWNSKYWFRRVGQHSAFTAIAARAHHVGESLRDSQPHHKEMPPHEWDPFAFVDHCQAALSSKPNEQARCLDLQQIEWESLFDYCYHAAISK